MKRRFIYTWYVIIKAKIIDIAANGYGHTIGLDDNGQMWSWGYNYYGQLGINTSLYINKCTPVSILGVKKTFCKIAAGYNLSFGIDKDGLVWGWGYNSNGPLGINSTVNKCTPVSILGAKKTFCEISCLYNTNTMGLDKNGQVWCWGDNWKGQLGINSTVNQCTPVSILGSKKTFCKISAGYYLSFGIDKDGLVWGWGYGSRGQLGINSTVNKCTPVSILGAKKTFCTINSNNRVTLGLDKNGQLWGWGYNNKGQLGDNTVISRLTPVSILGTKKTFCAISIGNSSSLGIDNTGQVWGWGYNNYGQLGDNSTTNKCTPVSIMGAKKTFCTISIGNSHSIGLDKDGHVWGWGYNGIGQLGDKTIISKRTPVRVCNF